MTANRTSILPFRQGSDLRASVIRAGAALRGLTLALALVAGQGALAQDAPAPPTPAPTVLTLDQDRLFRETLWGKAAIARAEAEGAALTIENRRIEEALQTEEQTLTDRRATMGAEDFARLAAEFDTRVEAIRTAQDTKSRAIVRQLEGEQQQFFTSAAPVMAALLRDTGASAILASGAVLYAADLSDITQIAIQRMDAAFPGLPPGSESDPPESPAAP
jgi:Skp family chaperone for outer membrane proteins